MDEVPFRRKTAVELEALPHGEREAYCEGELKRVHKEFGEQFAKGSSNDSHTP